MATNNSTNTANPSGVSAGSYTSTNLTVNAAGLITAASNGSGGGVSEEITQTAHGFSVGNWLYYNGTAYALAEATTVALAEVLGVVTIVQDANHFTLTYSGYVTVLTGLTAGDVYFLSDATPGAMVTSVPTTAGHVNKPVFVADSTTTGWVTPNRGEIVPVATTQVTSIGITSSTGLVVGNTPITTSGNITVDLPGGIGGNNLLINGDFAAFQRSNAALPGSASNGTLAVAASTTVYCFDRWQILTGANQACTITQVTNQANANSRSAGAVQRNNAQTGTGTIRFCQSCTIDMSSGLQDQVVTVSARIKCGANYSATSNALVVNVYTGTGTSSISGINGAFTGNTTNTSTWTLTTGYQNFSYTTPSLGSTITQIAVELAFTPTGTAGANDDYFVEWIKLEIGANATTYQFLPLPAVIAACQPFYQKSFAYSTAPASNVGVSTGEYVYTAAVTAALANNSASIPFQVQMRAAPTITLFSPGASGAQVYNETRSAALTSSTSQGPSINGFSVVGTGTAATIPGDVLGIHWTASAEIT